MISVDFSVKALRLLNVYRAGWELRIEALLAIWKYAGTHRVIVLFRGLID